MLSACGGSGTATPPGQVSGTFSLNSFNVTVPSSVPEHAFSWDISNPSNAALTCTLDLFGNGDELRTIQDCETTQDLLVTYEVFGVFIPKLTVSDGQTSREIVHPRIRVEPRTGLAPVFSEDDTVQDNYCVHVTRGEFASASVAIADVTANLMPPDNCSGNPGWSTNLDLSNLASDTYLAEIRAQTTDGQDWLYVFEILINRAPTIRVSAPVNHSVFQPTGRFTASCEDNDSVAMIGGTVESAVRNDNSMFMMLPEAQSSIDVEVDLSRFEGQEVDFAIQCTDESGVISQTRTVYVETSPALQESVVLDGLILDVRGDRVLHEIGTGAQRSLAIYTISSQETVEIPLSANQIDFVGLTTTGALIDTRTELYDWRDSELVLLGDNRGPAPTVAGDYAIYAEDRDQWVVRQFSSGTNTALPAIAMDLAPDGTVVLVDNNELSTWKDGVMTSIGNDPSRHVVLAATDGSNLVYARQAPNETVLFQNGTETALTNLAWPFLLSDGWVGFPRRAVSAIQPIVRDPQGNELQRSFFAPSTGLEFLSSTGDATIVRNQRRYWSSANGDLLQISSDLGTVYVVNNTDYLAIGRSLFAIDLSNGIPVSTEGAFFSPRLRSSISDDGNTLRPFFSSFSRFEIIAVTAEIESVSGGLQFFRSTFSSGSTFFGEIPVDSLPRGTYTVRVVAEDSMGNTIELEEEITIDRPPVVTLITPTEGTVANPTFLANVTCVDDDPDSRLLQLFVDSQVFSVTGEDIVDLEVDLTGDEGASSATASCTDSAGQRATQRVGVFGESNPRLTEIDAVDGPILDLTENYIFYQTPPLENPELWIKDRASGVVTSIPNDGLGEIRTGRITPDGVVYQDLTPSFGNFFHWRNGVIEQLPGRGSLIGVNEDFLVWDTNNPYLTYRRRFSTGDISVIGPAFAETEAFGMAANGTVAFVTDARQGSEVTINTELYADDAGTVTQVFSDPNQTVLQPLTDGARFLYLTQELPISQPYTRNLRLFDAGQVVTLYADIPNDNPRYQETLDYQLSENWIVYNKPGPSGLGFRQIWIRDAQGNEVQQTFEPFAPRIEVLADNGEVTYLGGENRTLIETDGSIGVIGSSAGRSYWINDTWYVVVGRSVFRVD